jgi:hypothetical protein
VIPLRFVCRNLLFGHSGEVAALYRVGTINYPFLSAPDKWDCLQRLERFAQVIGTDFSLWRVQRASFVPGHYTVEMESAADDRNVDRELWGTYCKGHEDRLAELDAHDPQVYIAVALNESGAGGGPGFVRSIDRARRRLERLAGVGSPRPVSAKQIEALTVAERRTFDRLAAVLDLERASTREIHWLLARGATRGLGEPDLDENWRPDAVTVNADDGAFEPDRHELWRHANVVTSESPGEAPALVVEGETGTGFQAFLAVGALALEADFPGAQAELLSTPLEAVGFPVDAVLHAGWVPNRDALSQTRKRILDAEHSYREQERGATAGPGYVAEEDRELAREFEAVLQSGSHPPMLRGWLSLAIGALTRDELERRVDVIREQFGDVTLHRPRGLQRQLFFDHFLRPADGGDTPDYEQQMTVEQFGALMPTATTQIGSSSGFYIGWTPTGRRPIRYDPTEASQRSRPATLLFAGTTGSGKTNAAEDLAFASYLRGSIVIDLDPRPDHGFDRVEQLGGQVEVLELSGAPEHRGALDPLAISPPDLREELAASYLLELLRDAPPSWENAIQRSVRDAVRAEEMNLLAVVRRLQAGDNDAAREAGDALEVLSDFGLARLGFGTGEGTSQVTTGGYPVTTIRTPGLTLPRADASRETYSRAERVSVATLSLAMALVMRLVSEDRSQHKFAMFDEAYFLWTTRLGRMLLDRLARMARSLNTTVVLISQMLADLAELANLIGVLAEFRPESIAEAEAALSLFGLDPKDKALISRLRSFPNGRCLLRDLDGEIGEAQIDLVFDWLVTPFDTRPMVRGENAAAGAAA